MLESKSAASRQEPNLCTSLSKMCVFTLASSVAPRVRSNSFYLDQKALNTASRSSRMEEARWRV